MALSASLFLAVPKGVGGEEGGAERHIGEAGRSVCGRECRSWVAGPIIYGASARRLSQFARGSAGPGSPVPLFMALPGRSREGPAGVASGPRKRVTLAK